MLPSTLADEFRTRAEAALPAMRRARALAAPVARHPRFGAYASLAAILLGGAMMMANIAREHHRVAPAVAARVVAPAPVKAAAVKAAPVKAAAAAKPQPDPIAAIASTSPALPKAAEKITQRIDTTPTASIAQEEPVKPKRARRHTHKRKPAESER